MELVISTLGKEILKVLKNKSMHGKGELLSILSITELLSILFIVTSPLPGRK